MGTDIHGWLEVRRAGTWHGHLNFKFLQLRDYRVFAALTVPARGMPDDASPETQDLHPHREGNYGHSWIDGVEAAQVDFRSLTFPVTGTAWQMIADEIQTLSMAYGAENVRLVYWFDS